MSEKSLYQILGVSPDASQAEIRTAYLRLAKEWHPDRNPDNEAEAERRFKEIAHAYDVLSDPDKRAAYDAAAGTGDHTAGFEGTMDEDAAFDLFISVLLDLAFELAENGADQITIYQALIDMGCPSGTAKTLAQRAHKLGGNGKAGGSGGKSTKTESAKATNDGNNYKKPLVDIESATFKKIKGREWVPWLIPFVMLGAILFTISAANNNHAPEVEASEEALNAPQEEFTNSTQESGLTGLDVIEAYNQVRNGTAPTPILQSAFVFDGMSADDAGMVTYQYTLAAQFTRSVDTNEFDAWVIGELSKGFCGIDMLRGLSRVYPQSKIQVSLKTWNGMGYGNYKTFLLNCP